MVKRIWLLTWLIVGILSFTPPSETAAQGGGPLVLVMTADAPVAPPMEQYIERVIQMGEQDGAELIIFQLNTPGGNLESMNNIVQVIRDSRVPFVVYVTPRGAMAASAGTIITLAGHASAMAPETIIGAASPVGGQGEDLGETMAAKEKNAMRATVRSLAQHRGEEAVALAEDTIENAMAVSSDEAFEVGLVDFIATDLNDLIRQLDGWTVVTIDGERTLETSNAAIREVSPSWIEQILQTLTNPNIVFLLITIGIQAILIELSSPGGWVAGFIGVACLALATYGLGVLPVNWFGLIFLIMAFALFILDVKAPTHGALTAAGTGSLILGALVLFNTTRAPGFPPISLPLVFVISLTTAGSFFVIISFAIRAQKVPIRTGQEGIIGRLGTVRTDLSPRGTVQVGGELWSAELADGDEPAPAGTHVRVIKVEGITLRVSRGEAPTNKI
ncbi:MAG: nodulation protein NfeD [Chloroflexota bacterium]|nr:MAG: nodulation protein NfeD [Chloroflexota bacterium]